MWNLVAYLVLWVFIFLILPLCCIFVRIRSQRLAKLCPRTSSANSERQRARNRLAAESDMRAREWALQLERAMTGAVV